MGLEGDSLSRESFLKLLRADLNHLYDADHLRQSPLLNLFGLSSRFDAPFALQSTLISAIEGLRPAKNDPAANHYWQIYQILNIRYIQQAGQEEVATQFGISVRQARREQQAALEFLGARLWNQFHLTPEKQQKEDTARVIEHEERGDASQVIPEKELSWITEERPDIPVDFSLLLPQVMELVEPLAQQVGVKVYLKAHMVLPLLSVRRVVLRQAMINLITLAIQVTTNKMVEIDSQMQGDLLSVQIRCLTGDSFTSRFEEQQASLELIRRMVEISGGQMRVETGQITFHAHLLLPVLKPVKVLVIDDNVDFFQLMQRYTENSRYQLTGIQDPTTALLIASQLQPEIIVLDVMMPQVDGWQLLRELKQDEQTAQALIVVCTVFAQKDLAFTLGADDFAQKPINQESLLAALDRQAARLWKSLPLTSAHSQSDH